MLLKQKGDTPVHKYRPGGAFGELALLYEKPRAASIKCTAPGVIYALDRATFRAVLMAGMKQQNNVSTRLLKRVHLLEGLTDQQLQSLVSILHEERFDDGALVCGQGAPMDSMYMVQDGLVHQSSSGADGSGDVQPYQQGDCFGMSALADEPGCAPPTWSGTISAVGTCTLLRLKREEMVALLGDLSSLLRDNFQQRVLGSIEMFKALSPSELSVLVDALVETRYVAGDRVISQGDQGDTFYILKSGVVRVSVKGSHGAEKEIAKLGTGDYFGEMALLQDAPRMASVTALEPTTCMTVDRATFAKVLGPLQALLEREAARRVAEVDELKSQREIALSDVKEVGVLGVGTFGRVALVEHKGTGKTYALKTMHKKQLIALKQVDHLMNEKALMAMCNHPFLIKLAGAFQDTIEVYMVLELALGGELFTLLRDRGRFDDAGSRFYTACVVSAFIHMHDKNIVYRDLKPENLLLDSSGYIKICDFGFAKQLEGGVTYTLCGTPEYLAPEIISNIGHGLPVDWWALGILVYELLCGDPPFMADDPMELYSQILRGAFSFPAVVGKPAKDLVTKLLLTSPSMRIGIAQRGHRDLVVHPFLKLIDMGALTKRQGKLGSSPPVVPKVQHETDMSNYDEMEEGADRPLDPSWATPVTAIEQQLFEGFSL